MRHPVEVRSILDVLFLSPRELLQFLEENLITKIPEDLLKAVVTAPGVKEELLAAIDDGAWYALIRELRVYKKIGAWLGVEFYRMKGSGGTVYDIDLLNAPELSGKAAANCQLEYRRIHGTHIKPA
jgi:hypothetical protein